MNKRWIWAGLLTALLIFLLGAGLVWARGGLAGPSSAPAAAPLEDAFTYQGELIRGEEPVGETCEMAFRLYDAADGGLQVGEPITTSVAVVDGLFTVPLDFGASAFPGEARSLGIAVKCPADPAFVAFPERQALTAAPYALYSKAAASAESAPWDGLTGVPAGFADGVDDVDDADNDPGNELNQAMALEGNTLVLTDTGTVSADLSGLAVRQLVADFVMASGESVSAGDLVTWIDGEAYGPAPWWGAKSVFDETRPGSVAMAALSETDFVIAYQDMDNSNHGTAIAGTVSDGVITWGDADVFNEAATGYIALEAVSATQLVIAYRDYGNSGYGTARAGTLTEAGFFWGPASVFNAAATSYLGLAALSATEVVIAYRDEANSGYGTAIPGTLSSGSLSWGTASVFNLGSTEQIAAAALSDTDVMVAYTDYSNSGYGTAVPGTLSGGSLAWGSESVFNAAQSTNSDVVRLSATGVVVTYQDYAQSGRATAIAGTLSGGGVAWGNASPVPSSPAYSPRVAALSETEVVVVYMGPGNAGTAVIGETAGEAIVWSRAGVFNADDIGSPDVAAQAGADFVVAYQDQSNADYGTARASNRMARRMIGVAQEAAAGGETVTAVMEGISDVQSGLTPGHVYFWQEDGSLGTTPGDARVGLALSATELLLDQLWTQ